MYPQLICRFLMLGISFIWNPTHQNTVRYSGYFFIQMVLIAAIFALMSRFTVLRNWARRHAALSATVVVLFLQIPALIIMAYIPD